MKDQLFSMKNSRDQITENCQIENFPLQEQLLSPKYSCDQIAESSIKQFSNEGKISFPEK